MNETSKPSAEMYSSILARQCRTAPAESGALIRLAGDGAIDLLAVHPVLNGTGHVAPWIVEASRRVAESADHGGAAVFPAARLGEPSYAAVPLSPSATTTGVWAVYLLSRATTDPGLVVERLMLSASSFQALESRGEVERRAGEVEKLQRTLAALTGLAAHDRFSPAAMALCNHAASEWKCERVSLGLAKGPYIRVEAMSHTEKIAPGSALVQDIESVMEECFDQDLEVVFPADPGETVLCRAAREFASRHGPMSLACIPLRRSGEPMGVLMLERPAEAPFTLAEAASLRLLAEAASTQVWLAHRYRRWFGASLAGSVRSMAAGLLGPSYAWAKLTALSLAGCALFFALVPGTYRVRGDARVEAASRRVVAGPYDGFLIASHAEAGDLVEEGELLATLDTTELLLRLGSLLAERDGAMREAALAQREGKDAEGQIARARARRAEADIKLLERQVEQAAIRSPAAGAIITGDLNRVIGAPVRMGDTLFEVASLGSLHVEVFVSEDQVADIAPGSRGALAPISSPDVKLPVTVTRIDPVAQVRGGRNVFRAIASLDERPEWLRPGMEGTVRIEAGQRSYPWIWTRRVVNWVRMQLWI